MSKNDRGYTIHVVSHTHWDREWRYPFQITRAMLIDMIDRLLEVLDSTPEYKSFLLDSQCIILEDYLAVKPEREGELRRQVETGRLVIGPWYSLPDTPEISGESIVRNLLLGSSIIEEWKGTKWTGYSPFSFGQSSQIPQIYRGFGIDHIYFYRGNNDRITKNEYIWEAPDGSRIMGMRAINPYGRANWYVHVYRPLALNKWPFQWEFHWEEGQLPFHPCNDDDQVFDYRLLEGKHCEKLFPENLPKALEEIRRDAIKDSTCPHLLYMDGMDQAHPYPRTPEIVEMANRLHTPDTYIHCSFADYVQAVKDSDPDLKVMEGEFRYPMVDGLWQNLFPGMLSARIYLKQQNRQCEAMLQKNADTWAAIAELLGMEYPQGMIDLAWKYLLANQAHDSIAGCGVDSVHEDVEYRFRQVSLLASDITQRALAHIVRNIDNKQLPENAICLFAFNPTQFKRSEVVRAIIDIPRESGISTFSVEDERGEELQLQILRGYDHEPIVNHPYDFPVPFKAKRFHCAILLPGIPGLGYRTFRIKRHRGPDKNPGSMSPAKNTLENRFVYVKILSDGRLDVLNKESAVWYRGLHYFKDCSETGDHGTHRPADSDEILTSIGEPAEIEKVVDGPILIQYKIKVTLMLPRNALPDRSSRNPEKVPFPITSVITLRTESRFLEIRTETNNQVLDHKLQVMFPSGYRNAERSFSETHFAVTYRNIQPPDTSAWKEPMLPFYPQYMFAGIENGKTGLAIFNIGLPEYAAFADRDRTIGLTLLRTYRFPVIGANPEDTATDWSQRMCQCLRPFVFDYAIYPYRGDWREGEVHRHANQFNLPLRLNQTGPSKGFLPTGLSFITIEPDDIVLSGVKKSSRNDNLIIRMFNPTPETIEAKISFYKRIRQANLTNLKEQVTKNVDFQERSLRLTLGKSKIITLAVALET